MDLTQKTSFCNPPCHVTCIPPFLTNHTAPTARHPLIALTQELIVVNSSHTLALISTNVVSLHCYLLSHLELHGDLATLTCMTGASSISPGVGVLDEIRLMGLVAIPTKASHCGWGGMLVAYHKPCSGKTFDFSVFHSFTMMPPTLLRPQPGISLSNRDRW